MFDHFILFAHLNMMDMFFAPIKNSSARWILLFRKYTLNIAFILFRSLARILLERPKIWIHCLLPFYETFLSGVFVIQTWLWLLCEAAMPGLKWKSSEERQNLLVIIGMDLEEGTYPCGLMSRKMRKNVLKQNLSWRKLPNFVWLQQAEWGWKKT